MDTPIPKRRRGIYLLPNLFTTGTLFGGFYAIIASMRGDFSSACIAVVVAMVADSLDGLIARKTNTASDFGKEYDSLCDMVAFGVAASLVSYNWALHMLAEYKWLGGKLGWVIAFTYTACAALRLARFNVLATRGGAKGAFFGLPSPGAAATPKATMSQRLSYSLPNSLAVLVLRAIRPSSESQIMAMNTATAAASNSWFIAAMMA